MKRNVGGFDRLARLVFGTTLLVAALTSVLGIAPASPLVVAGALVVGLVLTVTGTVGVCPVFRVLGIDTHRE